MSKQKELAHFCLRRNVTQAAAWCFHFDHD